MIYCFECPQCKTKCAVERPMADSGLPEQCACGQDMDRDFQAEHSNVRGDYDKPIVSDSMAFDSIDLAEHRKRFPDVDVKVDGRSAYPILRSLRQKRRYLKGRNCIDRNSFI